MDKQVSLIACRILNNLFNDKYIQELPDVSKQEAIIQILLECAGEVLISLNEKYNMSFESGFITVANRLTEIILDRTGQKK